MRFGAIVFGLLLLTAVPLHADDGLISVKSAFAVKETADRLESA